MNEIMNQALSHFSDRSDLYSHNDIFEVFKANPDELDNYELMQHLLTKSDPLPDSLVDELKLMADTITARTAVEDRIAENTQNLDLSLGVLIRFGLLDSAMESLDTIRGYFLNKEDMSSDLAMVASYLQQYATQKAEACLDSIQFKYSFSPQDSMNFANFLKLKSLQIEAINDGRDLSQLDSTEVLELKSIAETSKAIAGYQAQSILNYFYGYDYFIDAILPETNSELKVKSTGDSETPSKKINDSKTGNRYLIQALPNPVNNVCILRFEMPDNSHETYIQIQNINGQLIQQYKLNESHGERIWDSSGLQAGLYICNLMLEGQVKNSCQIIKL